MPIHRRSHGLKIDAAAAQATEGISDRVLVSPSMVTPNLVQNQNSLPYTGQTNATPSEASSTKSHRRVGHRFKQASISSGTLVQRPNTVVRPPDLATIDEPKTAKPQPDRSTGSIQSTAMADPERIKSRKDRTFVGGSCAACELPLEHKLSGEKVLQFSCGHVAHEKCLYEVLQDADEEEMTCPECEAPLGLDSTRGGSILDLNQLSSMVRSIAQAPAEMAPVRASINTSKTWDESVIADDTSSIVKRLSGGSTHESVIEGKDGQLSRMEKLVGGLAKSRNVTESTNSFHAEEEPADARKHDFDLTAMEAKLAHVDATKDIPRPKVTIRSEFPTVTRSTQQQSLTCLVTVEVPATKTRSRQHGALHPLSRPALSSESSQMLESIANDLKLRVDNWHGLEVDSFGPLRLHANLKVGRDGTNWQKLDCYLFSELLICVRERRAAAPGPNGKPRCQLKGSILIKQHLKDVECLSDDLTLTLNLSVATLPTFRLKFSNREQLDSWRLALLRLDVVAPNLYGNQDEQEASGTEDDERRGSRPVSTSSTESKATTAPTDYEDDATGDLHLSNSLHVPIDVVVVIPLSSQMQGLKIRLLKDALRFMITHLGERDRMGLVTFGSNGGAMPLVGMATKDWYGWRNVYRSIKPIGQKSLRADPIEGANAALDLLSQRHGANPVSSIFLISDSSNNETENMDFVVQRAHANKVSVQTFGLGQTHKPDNLIELSSRTNASYTYVKDWMMLRECVAGCIGSLQSVSHISAKLKLKIPEGSIAKFVKISGALHTSKRTNGREAEAVLGDLRFGDKRDVLVLLSVDPDASMNGNAPHDHWETVVSGLATLGGSLDDNEQRPQSVEEIPLVQADLSYGDLAKDGAVAHLSHPSLLTITLLPSSSKVKRSSRGSIIPPIPSHPSIVQRRMEMLTSDMLTRALTLMSKSQHENAHRLLAETRTILQGLGKGSLPPLPPAAAGGFRSSSVPKEARNSPRIPNMSAKGRASPKPSSEPSSGRASPQVADERRASARSLTPERPPPMPRGAATIDPKILQALDHDIEACLEFIDHPAVFSHDARKAALQTIGVISSQRGYTFRTNTERYWASRIRGVNKMAEITKDWQMVGNDTLTEEI